MDVSHLVSNKILNNRRSYCTFFLVACTRLYKPLCPSVGLSVGLSVGRSVAVGLEHATYGDRPCLLFVLESVYPIRHLCLSIKLGMTVSPSNQACPSVHPIRPVCQSIKSGILGSLSNQACLANQQCPAVPRL